MADVKISELMRYTPITDGVMIPCSVKVDGVWKSRAIKTNDFVNYTYAGVLEHLTAGRAIAIDWNAEHTQLVVDCDLDVSVAKVVSELPEVGTTGIEKDKLYLVPTTNPAGSGDNIYSEYIYLDKGEGVDPRYVWEKIGERHVETNLEGYATETWVNTQIGTATNDMATQTWVNDQNYQPKGDYVTETSYNTLKGTVAAIETAYVSKSELVSCSYATTSAVEAKYTKPEGGIPASDLAEAVQQNLTKASTALQADDITGKQDQITDYSKLSSDLVDDTDKTHLFVTAAEKNAWNGKTTMADVVAKNYLVAADIAGKQNTIDADHKLSADLVDDSSTTNKFVTADEKTAWNNKQAAINADNKLSADFLAEGDTNLLVTKSEKDTWNGKQAAITAESKLSADLLSEGTTNKLVSQAEKDEWSGKQAAISDLTTIRSNAEAGKAASDLLNPTGTGEVTYAELKAEVVALRAIVNDFIARFEYSRAEGATEATWGKEFLVIDSADFEPAETPTTAPSE